MKKQRTLLEDYIHVCQLEMSYVGGNGVIEDQLWEKITGLAKDLKRDGIPVPAYETIECLRDDWV
jgi:hypothetical protein